MFADYGYQGYGAYGRSLRKSFKRIVKAPAKIIKAPVRAITKTVTKVTKPIVGTAIGLTKMAVSKIAPKSGASVESLVEGPLDQPTIESNIAPQIDVMTQPTIPQAVATVQPQQPTMQQIQEMIRASMQYMQPLQSPPVQQTYVPQQTTYAQPIMQTQEYKTEQGQPQESYYSEDNYPVSEGSVMENEFTQKRYEPYDYPEEDFGGYGLDDETVALLIKETVQNPNAAIEAGQKYVAEIQGRKNTTGGSIVTEKETEITAIPTWAWFAIGAAALLAIAPSKRGRKKR